MKRRAAFASFMESQANTILAFLVSVAGVVITIVLAANTSTPGRVRWTTMLLIGLFLVFALWQVSLALKAIRRILVKHIPICVIVGKTDEQARVMWDQAVSAMKDRRLDIDAYLRDNALNPLELVYHERHRLSADASEWEEIARSFRVRLTRIQEKLGGRVVFHVFVNAPNALALGLGAAVGVHYEIVVYHYKPGVGDSPYVAALDFSNRGAGSSMGTRVLEQPIGNPTDYVEIDGKLGDETNACVSIMAELGDPRTPAEAHCAGLRKKGISACTIHIKAKGKTLESDDRLPFVRSALTALRPYLKADRKYDLFLDAHMVESFGIGMGLAPHWSIIVHQKLDAERPPVLDLRKLA